LKKLVCTGGGSAGHVIPTLPIMEYLIARSWQVVYVGSTSGLEERLVKPLDVTFHSIMTGKLRRYWSMDNLVDFFRVPIGVAQAIRILRKESPDVVFSKGGYVAFPIVFAAWLCRVPVVAHESDVSPGLANRLCFRFVNSLCVNFGSIRAPVPRLVVTGTPMRRALLEGNAERGRERLGFQQNIPIILVVGGSLGALRLNRLIHEALDLLVDEFDVVHVCGLGNVDATHENDSHYRQLEYVDDGWGDILACADVVISRAGANSVVELLTLNKPNILVPLPATVSRGDQIENAEFAHSAGYSKVLQEDELNVEILTRTIREVFSNRSFWQERLSKFGSKDALALIISEIERAIADVD